jgi:hypothetical protein
MLAGRVRMEEKVAMWRRRATASSTFAGGGTEGNTTDRLGERKPQRTYQWFVEGVRMMGSVSGVKVETCVCILRPHSSQQTLFEELFSAGMRYAARIITEGVCDLFVGWRESALAPSLFAVRWSAAQGTTFAVIGSLLDFGIFQRRLSALFLLHYGKCENIFLIPTDSLLTA